MGSEPEPGVVQPVEYYIDFDAPPPIPPRNQWDLHYLTVSPEVKQSQNRVRGVKEFSRDILPHLSLCLDKRGANRRSVAPEFTVFPAHLLDFFLKYPHLTPSEFDGKTVAFWTIYCYRYDCIRYMSKSGNVWRGSHCFIDGGNPGFIAIYK